LALPSFAPQCLAIDLQDYSKDVQTTQKQPKEWQEPKKFVASSSDIDSQWADSHGPWDFTGVLGLFNPGVGFQALGAYRINDNLIKNVDESLSFETGIGYLVANDSYAGASVVYSEIEIPFMARWDFRIPKTKVIAGPRMGFTYLSAGTITSQAVQVTMRGGALYYQMGGFGMYQINDQWAARVQLMFVNYTDLTFGVTYFL
jgi:hypothetical protein